MRPHPKHPNERPDSMGTRIGAKSPLLGNTCVNVCQPAAIIALFPRLARLLVITNLATVAFFCQIYILRLSSRYQGDIEQRNIEDCKWEENLCLRVVELNKETSENLYPLFYALCLLPSLLSQSGSWLWNIYRYNPDSQAWLVCFSEKYILCDT